MVDLSKINKESINKGAKLIVATGHKRIGKTVQGRKEADAYLKEKKLRVLALDINGDDYVDYQRIRVKDIHNLGVGKKYRILPFRKNETGSLVRLPKDELRKVMQYMLENMYNGLLILDDFDRHSRGAKTDEMVSVLTGCRHQGVDLLITHQSVAKISTSEWENIDILRMHHQTDNISRYRSRVANFPLVKIGQLIVDEVYYTSEMLYAKNKITKDDWLKTRGYFVYIDFNSRKIRNCTETQMLRAVEKFVAIDKLNFNEEKQIMKITNKKVTNKMVTEQLIKKYMLFFDKGSSKKLY